MRLIALLALAVAVPVYAFDLPANDGFLTDDVGIIQPDDATALRALLKEYRDQTNVQVAVVILKSRDNEPADVIASQINAQWGLQNRSIIMMLFYDETEYSFWISPTVGSVSDTVLASIIEFDILPKARDGQYVQSILSGLDALQKHLDGVYSEERYVVKELFPWGKVFVTFIVFMTMTTAASYVARFSPYWVGGVVGAVLGIVMILSFFSAKLLWSLPVMSVLGFGADAVWREIEHVTKKSSRRRRRR